MSELRPLGGQGGQVETLDQIELLAQFQPGAGGQRTAIDVQPAIMGADRIAPARLIGLEIVEAQPAAGFGRKARKFLRDGA